MNLLRRAQRLDDDVFGVPPKSLEERLATLHKFAGEPRTYAGISAQAILDLAGQVEALRSRVEQLEAARR